MANYAQNASPTISHFKIFPRTPAYQKWGNPPLGLSPTCACSAWFVPPALNSPPTL
jgi:hypothetical protein